MDGRRRYALGGAAIVTASAALVIAVAMTNTAALEDSPGDALGHAGIVVPDATPAVPTPEVPPTPEPEPEEPETAEPAAPVADPSETVAAPSPIEVTVVPDDSQMSAWDAATLRAWAEEHDWSSARIERWLDNIERLRAGSDAADAEDVHSGWTSSQTSVTGSSDWSWDRGSGDGADQSRDSPDRRD
ncbi:hypothetical protein [Microbacterium thalassium]|uniref:Uncharacterized protein n=1 Tax=Microbacterium thalassium TaxID=362649 RepID=A0A7X0KVM1_9MICO|nr:hypothetical protein [Microbacterium thalassium]MBB6392386.1 hypothetical protein [Microbacterium thalassium]GLK25081.1 hypothetical protein GCM10017607_23990 [Microbacterium thalassium]